MNTLKSSQHLLWILVRCCNSQSGGPLPFTTLPHLPACPSIAQLPHMFGQRLAWLQPAESGQCPMGLTRRVRQRHLA